MLTLDPQAGIPARQLHWLRSLRPRSTCELVQLCQFCRHRRGWALSLPVERRDGQGQALSAGVYDFEVQFEIRYRTDMLADWRRLRQPAGLRLVALSIALSTPWSASKTSSLKLNSQGDDPFGAGWILTDQQRLYVNDTGQINVAGGYEPDAEYYFLDKDRAIVGRERLGGRGCKCQRSPESQRHRDL